MRKFIIAFIAILLLLTSSYGQTKNDSIEAYKKVNKWAVVKLTIAYMEDLRNWSSEFEKKNVKPHLVNEFDDYIKLVKSYNKYSESIDLDKFSSLLDENWLGTKEAVFEKYKIELSDSASVYNFENISFVPRKASIQNRLDAIRLINEEYSSLLPKQEKQDKKVKEVEVASSQTDLNTNTIENKDKSNLDQIILYVLLVISMLLNAFLLLKLKSILKNNSINNKNNIHQEYDEALKAANENLQNKIKELSEEIDSLKLKKERVETEKVSPVEDEKTRVIEFTVDDKVKEDFKKIIFLPSPFEERRFAVEDVSEIEKPTSLYVAEIDENSNKGIITLIEGADLSRALNSPNIYLETVCEYENAYNPVAKGIRVVEDGAVVLEAEDWVVTTKIRIKFI